MRDEENKKEQIHTLKFTDTQVEQICAYMKFTSTLIASSIKAGTYDPSSLELLVNMLKLSEDVGDYIALSVDMGEPEGEVH